MVSKKRENNPSGQHVDLTTHFSWLTRLDPSNIAAEQEEMNLLLLQVQTWMKLQDLDFVTYLEKYKENMNKYFT